MMDIFLCIFLGYAVGCINPAYLIGKLRGFDIRRSGSGNAGASNALITMGKAAGVFSMLFDIAKAVFVTQLCAALFPLFAYAFPLAASACILGHIFPFYMKFRGGKGLACLGGAVLSYNWKLFLLALAIALLLLFLTDYICIVPIAASVAFVIAYGIFSQSLPGALILLPATAAIEFRHIENLQRIKNGTEMHFSYLWRRDQELSRIKENTK